MTTPNPRVPNPFLGHSSLSRRQLIKRAGVLGAAGLSLPAFLAACGGGSDDDASSGASGSSPGSAAAADRHRRWRRKQPVLRELAGLHRPDRGRADRHGRPLRRGHRASTCSTPRRSTTTTSTSPRSSRCSATATRSTPTSSPRRRGWPAGSSSWAGSTSSRSTRSPTRRTSAPTSSSRRWDPTGEYSLPWQTGFGGIAYNIDVTGRELTSADDLFDPEFNGKIGMLTRDARHDGHHHAVDGHRHLDPRPTSPPPSRPSPSSSRRRTTDRSAASPATTT